MEAMLSTSSTLTPSTTTLPNQVQTRKEDPLLGTCTGFPSLVCPLAQATLSSVREFFQRDTHHRPSDAMWEALEDLAVTLEAMVEGECPPRFYLSSLDPGVGKTQTISRFLVELLKSEKHRHAGVLISVSRLDEIKSLVEGMHLSDASYAVLTSDERLNALGSRKPDVAPILFTTQQMVEKRCVDRRFKDVSAFHYRGSPRRVRIWDESILPGQTLTLNRDDIGFLFKPLRGRYPDLTGSLDALFAALGSMEDGQVYDVPDFVAQFRVDVNAVLQLLEGYPQDQQAAASALWFLSRKSVVVRRDGHFGNTLLDYRETLPKDLAPMVILDASGRVRHTYREWESNRGNLVRLKTAEKSYRNLKVHVWTTSGGKSAFASKGNELADGIATTINSKPDQEWLVVAHRTKPGGFDLELAVRHLLRADQSNVHFITWGNHHATNKYSDVSNVILGGTLFYRPSYYEALGRLSSGLSASDGVYPRDSLHRIVQGEHAHLVLQALCRGSVRQCDGDACRPCDAYVIASVRSGIPEALPMIFPGCKVERWTPVPKALKGKVKEAVDFISIECPARPDGYVPFRDVMRAIGMTDSTNFRNRIREHEDFQRALAELGIVEHGRGRYPRGFLQVTDIGAYYGFEDIEEEV